MPLPPPSFFGASLNFGMFRWVNTASTPGTACADFADTTHGTTGNTVAVQQLALGATEGRILVNSGTLRPEPWRHFARLAWRRIGADLLSRPARPEVP